ncbi:MAG: NADH-quinone oxidoreductase subunit H, partial [Nitrospinota bacterium]
WSMLGGLRAAAQMLSYEVAMGLSIVGVLMVYGSLKLTEIGALQEDFFRWGIFTQPLAFLIFLTCAIAENKRPPFDVAEAEPELVAGYFTEYSGMKFVMFWMGEFLEIVTISGVLASLFFGAWHLPFISDAAILNAFGGPESNMANILAMLVAVGTFLTKLFVLIWFQMQIRWTLPRFRYDQIMQLGWKVLLPLALLNIFITGVLLV